jgi:hypothetical protein
MQRARNGWTLLASRSSIELEILDARERTPRMSHQDGAAEQHPIPDQVGGHAKPEATGESHSVEEQEPSCHEPRSTRAERIGQHGVVRLGD